jgi:hypothetical protein
MVSNRVAPSRSAISLSFLMWSDFGSGRRAHTAVAAGLFNQGKRLQLSPTMLRERTGIRYFLYT